MKDCKKIHPLLSLFAEGALPDRVAKRVEAHLSSCADARQELEDQRRLRKTLLALPEPAMPRDLHDKIMGRVTGKLRPLRPHKPFFNFPIAGLAVAACLVLYLVVSNPEMLKLSHPPSVPQEAATGILKNTGPATSHAPAPTAKDKGFQLEAKKEAPAHYGYAVQPDDERKQKTTSLPEAFEGNVKRSKKAEAPPAMPVLREEKAAAPSAANSYDMESLSSGAGTRAAAPTGMAQAAPRAMVAARQDEAPVPTEGYLSDIAFYKKIAGSTWSGTNGPAEVENSQLITDAPQFEAVWRTLRPSEPVPAVDFTTQVVLFIQAGQKPTGGYGVQVKRIEETTDQVIVHYWISPPAPNPPAPPSRPWTLQVIPKPSKPVVFQKD